MSSVNKLMIQKDKQLVYQSVAIVSLTEAGRQQAECIETLFQGADSYVTAKRKKRVSEKLLPKASFKESLQQLFVDYDYLICIMATGIVVRSLAAVVEDKRYDPAVLVLDEKAQCVISLLSGHIGGGNDLTRELAEALGAIPVITTATDTQNVTALDLIAKSSKASYENFREKTLIFNSLLAAHGTVGFYQEQPYIKDLRGLTVLDSLVEIPEKLDGLIVVSTNKEPSCFKTLTIPTVQVVPKHYLLGMGSRKDIAKEIVAQAFANFCELYDLSPLSISKIVSIDVKKNEKGLIALADQLACPFETYSKDVLKEASTYYPSSDFVKKQVGIGNVASSSAHYASNGQVLTERYSYQGVTIVLAKKDNNGGID